MLRPLVGLGLVRRDRTHPDRRTRIVGLTAQGLARLRFAVRRLMHSGAAQLAVDCVLAGRRWYDDAACFRAADTFETYLFTIRDTTRDSAMHLYPWHPDD
jgi:hypothetical protein